MATEESKLIPDDTEVDTDRISCVINDVQNQLRALVDLARSDVTDEETLRVMSECVGIRAHLMLDECLKEMGETQAGNFQDSFEDLDARRGVAHG